LPAPRRRSGHGSGGMKTRLIAVPAILLLRICRKQPRIFILNIKYIPYRFTNGWYLSILFLKAKNMPKCAIQWVFFTSVFLLTGMPQMSSLQPPNIMFWRICFRRWKVNTPLWRTVISA